MAKTKSASPATKARASTGSSPAPTRRPAGRKAVGTSSRRLWLSYPPERIKQPLIWEMSRRFPVKFDIRQASVTDKIGILCLEIEGAEKEVESAIAWLRKSGVRVEPVELSAMES